MPVPRPAVAACGLTRRFGRRYALRDASFAVAPGEILGLVGPNGAGKSTTFRLLTGELLPDAGTATVWGTDPAAAPYRARRRLGFLPEEVPLPAELRVEEFLLVRARLKGLCRREARGRVAALLARLDLGRWARTPLGHLSRGYRQRVGLAAACVHDPPVLLLDEPTAGLDPHQRLWFRRWLGELRGGRTVLVSSHELLELERVCDRFLLLREGRVVACGPLAELRPPRLRLAIEGGEDDWAALLAAVPGVRAVAPSGAAWRLTVRPGTDPRAAVARAVAARGGVVVELAWERPDLEGLYGELLGRRG